MVDRALDDVPPDTPVLVGAGLVSQREDDPARAREPLALMVDAARAAARDAAAEPLLREVDSISVPKGRWRYRDPGRAVARSIGADRARTRLATVGVLQETLVGQACEAIAEGESRVALVVGGEAGYRLRRAHLTGAEPVDSQQDSTPDELLRPGEAIMTPAEVHGGLGDTAAGYYAIIDSAFRRARGIRLDEHRDAIARMYGEFSRIAAANPAAWKRAVAAPEVIRDDSAANPMIAFPYTKAHVSNWSVDQASALLLCSAEAARSAGVPADRWVFPLASAVSDHMVPLSERAELHRSPGAELAARRALDHAGVVPDRITCADIYSCFPVAVLVHAAAVGLPGSIPFTVTGGMPFAGGPFNNYALHATVQLARHLRRRPHGTGVVSSVSGVLTKHGFGVWGIDPPVSPFRFDDVTAATAATTRTTPVVGCYQGGGRIAGSTVIYENGHPRRAVAVIDTDDGRRALAWSEDPMVMADMARDEFGGHPVMVRSDTFTPLASSAADGGRG